MSPTRTRARRRPPEHRARPPPRRRSGGRSAGSRSRLGFRPQRTARRLRGRAAPRSDSTYLGSANMAKTEKPGVHATTREKLDWLAELRDDALHAGSEKSVARQREQGKLLARERAERLCDPGSFVELDR